MFDPHAWIGVDLQQNRLQVLHQQDVKAQDLQIVHRIWYCYSSFTVVMVTFQNGCIIL